MHIAYEHIQPRGAIASSVLQNCSVVTAFRSEPRVWGIAPVSVAKALPRRITVEPIKGQHFYQKYWRKYVRMNQSGCQGRPLNDRRWQRPRKRTLAFQKNIAHDVKQSAGQRYLFQSQEPPKI